METGEKNKSSFLIWINTIIVWKIKAHNKITKTFKLNGKL